MSVSKILPLKSKQSNKLIVVALIVLLSISTVIVFSNNFVSADTSLQDMIDDAEDGETINVLSGTYGNIVIDKPLTLIGENKENTIIDGEGIGHTVRITAEDVTFSGFTVINSGLDYPDSGIYLDDADDAVITDNIVQDNSGYGIFVNWGSNNIVSDNIISNCANEGIRVDCSDATIDHNTISDCGMGILLDGAQNVVVTNNDLARNQISVQGESRSITISHNRVDGGNGLGIRFYASYDSVIENNEITGVSGDGIVVQGQSAFLTIKANNIHENIIANGAIIIEDGSSNNDVVDNIIEDNANNDVGVIINGNAALYNRITSNRINTVDVGIYLNEAAYVMVRGNSITTTIKEGVFGSSCQHIGIIENTIQAKIATRFETSSYISIVHNNLTQASLTADTNAVYLDHCQNSWVTNNDISVQEIGIWIDGPESTSAQNHVNGNNLTGNVQALVLDKTQSNVIEANNFTSNTASNGALRVVFGSTDNTITQNNFVGNTIDVYVDEYSTDNNFDDNYWDDYESPSPYVIDEDPVVEDNSPLDTQWVYLPVYNTVAHNYYSNIQDAIDVASDGDIIEVANGVYNENVNVFQSVQLIGASPEGTIIDSNHDGVCIRTAPETSDIVIENFALINGGENGICLQGTQYAVVSNNFVYNNAYSGLYQDHCSENTISDNRFVNNYQSGVYISGSFSTALTDNNIEYNHENGISLITVIDSIVESNIITHNMGDGLGTNNGCVDLVLTSNTVTDNWVNGFGVAFTTDTELTDNTAANNWQDGYALFMCSAVELVDNTAQGNHEIGIYLSNTHDINVLLNCISQSEQGLQIDDGSNNYIAENEIFNNNNIGALIQREYSDTSQNVFTGNTLTANEYGVQLAKGAHNNQITNNDITLNRIKGILLRENSILNVISGNTITDNGDGGIGLETGSSQNEVTDNTLTGNGGDGLNLSDSANNNQITQNTIESSGAEGIRLVESSILNVISGNTVTGSGGDGIGIETRSSQNDIINNYVVGSACFGIHPHGGPDNVDHITDIYIVGNTLENNGVGIILTDAWNCQIYHNNFVDNTDCQAITEATSAENVWDDGYPSGGNYWNDNTNQDLYRGSSQNELGSDGIGDSAYTIAVDNEDNYPLVNPFYPIEMTALNYNPAGQLVPITIFSNVTITDVTSTPGMLSFTATGPSGEIGYIRAIIPIDATNTNPQLIVDGTPIDTSSITIETNSTHYFIYATFTLSSHDIGLLFAIPEYAYAGLLSLIVCFAAFGVYRRKTKTKSPI